MFGRRIEITLLFEWLRIALNFCKLTWLIWIRPNLTDAETVSCQWQCNARKLWVTLFKALTCLTRTHFILLFISHISCLLNAYVCFMWLHIFMDLSLHFHGIGLGLRLWLRALTLTLHACCWWIAREGRDRDCQQEIKVQFGHGLLLLVMFWYIFLHQCSVHHVYIDRVWQQSPAAIDVRYHDGKRPSLWV